MACSTVVTLHQQQMFEGCAGYFWAKLSSMVFLTVLKITALCVIMRHYEHMKRYICNNKTTVFHVLCNFLLSSTAHHSFLHSEYALRKTACSMINSAQRAIEASSVASLYFWGRSWGKLNFEKWIQGQERNFRLTTSAWNQTCIPNGTFLPDVAAYSGEVTVDSSEKFTLITRSFSTNAVVRHLKTSWYICFLIVNVFMQNFKRWSSSSLYNSG